MKIRKYRILIPSAVKAELESQKWEPSIYDPNIEERSTYLGGLINPSGKYYTPWAYSNLDPCPRCAGTGIAKMIPCRVCKGSLIRPLNSAFFPGNPCYCANHEAPGKESVECSWCDGSGSREAALDARFWERLEQEADSLGLSIEAGEGDPCDTFLAEYREKEEKE